MTIVTWSGLLGASTDTGSPVSFPNSADVTVQVSGTFGATGSVTFEGSVNGTNYLALTDPQGNAITKTAAGIELVTEAPRYYRPNVTAGDGSTDLTVTAIFRRGAR